MNKDIITQDALGDAYDKLLAVNEIMEMTLDSMHTTCQAQDSAIKAKCFPAVADINRQIKHLKHVLFTQKKEIYEVLQMLEQIAPDACNDELL